MKFAITSDSVVKVDGLRAVLNGILGDKVQYEIISSPVPSGVSDQPFSLEETKCGAVNRIMHCDTTGIDYYVSVESGIDRSDDAFYSFTYAVVSDAKKNKFGFGSSSFFPIPDYISRRLKPDQSLRTVCPHKEGLIGFLTNGFKTRKQLVEEAITAALIPFDFFQQTLQKKVDIDRPLTPTLIKQLNELDFEETKPFIASLDAISPVKPCDYDDDREGVYQNGIQMVTAGECAVVIMCGGQGTRFGENIPKALFQLDIPSHSTLLELQLRRIKKLMNLLAAHEFNPKPIPVYILTSESTHSAIAAYLIRKKNFGLPFVKLICQRCLPVHLEDGGLAYLGGRIKTAPNGNGSVFETLKNNNCFEEMRRMGVTCVDIHPIDNILNLPCDPFFIGAMFYDGADGAIKVVKKVGKGERMGTVCQRNGKTIVVEYSEIPEEKAEEFAYGNTAMHLFSLDVCEKAAEVGLPYHTARKLEDCEDLDGKVEKKTVLKQERFIFDVMELCEQIAIVEVKREEEFAPIKNGFGSPVDSPETAREKLLALHRKWAEEAEIKLEGEGDFEILPETSYGGEGILESQYSGMTFKLPFSI